MKKQILVTIACTLVVALVSACATSGAVRQERIAAAIADPGRSADDIERDARSRPEVVLGFLQLDEGDTAADILGGGGYYAELMRRVVGDSGTAILQNNTPYMKFVEKSLEARYGQGQVPNLKVLKSEVDDLQLSPNSLDAALMVMSFHDLYYVNPDRGWGNTDIPQFIAQLRTALKPGSRLVIVDHAARGGSGISDTPEIHRIDEDFVRNVFVDNGFRFVTDSDVLRNPNDPRTQMVFDKSIRGKTDRFMLVFER